MSESNPVFTARVFENPAHISRDWWNSLAHPSLYLWYDWLLARSQTIHGLPRFICVCESGDKPVMGVPAYLTDGSSHPGYDPVRLLDFEDLVERDVQSHPGVANALTSWRAELAANGDGLRPSITVSAPGRMAGVSYAPQLSPVERRNAIATAADAIESQAARDGARTISWQYFIEGQDAAVSDELRMRKYMPIVVGADCYLPLTWTSFDGYLAGFNSKRRWKIKHEMATLAAAGVSVELHGAEALGPDLAKLELQWRGKYGRRAVFEETVADYQSLRKHIGYALHVFIAKRDGVPIGFFTFFEDGPTWWGRFGGFDYSTGNLFLYFNLLFYHPIQVALARGIKCLAYSLSSYETKCNRGCLLRNFLAYVRFPKHSVNQCYLETIDIAQRRRFERIGQVFKGASS